MRPVESFDWSKMSHYSWNHCAGGIKVPESAREGESDSRSRRQQKEQKKERTSSRAAEGRLQGRLRTVEKQQTRHTHSTGTRQTTP